MAEGEFFIPPLMRHGCRARRLAEEPKERPAMDDKTLVEHALKARSHAYTPYSH